MRNLIRRISLLTFPVVMLLSVNTYASDVGVSNVYARAIAEGQTNSAAFMILTNNGKQARALVSATSSVSATVELHTHKLEDGMMRMRKVDKIDIRAGGMTELKPGGLHIMFIGLKKQLQAGDTVDLELVFDNGDTISVSAPVKQVAGMKKMEHMKKHAH